MEKSGANKGSASPAKSQSAIFAAIRWVRGLQLPLPEKAALFALASRVDRNYSCFPALRQLGKDSGLRSAAHISRTLRRLRQRGLIEVHERPARKGRFASNHYYLKVDASPVSKPNAYKATDQLPDEQQSACSANNLSNQNEVSSPKSEQTGDSSSSDLSVTADPCHQTITGESGENDEKNQKNSSNLQCGADILRAYRRDNPSPDNIVGYWWALKYFHFPNTKYYGPRQLPGRQFCPLMVLFRKTFPALEAFELIWWVFEVWAELRELNPAVIDYCSASTYPTPSFILQCAERLSEIKLMCKDEWEPKLQTKAHGKDMIL